MLRACLCNAIWDRARALAQSVLHVFYVLLPSRSRSGRIFVVALCGDSSSTLLSVGRIRVQCCIRPDSRRRSHHHRAN